MFGVRVCDGTLTDSFILCLMLHHELFCGPLRLGHFQVLHSYCKLYKYALGDVFHCLSELFAQMVVRYLDPESDTDTDTQNTRDRWPHNARDLFSVLSLKAGGRCRSTLIDRSSHVGKQTCGARCDWPKVT